MLNTDASHAQCSGESYSCLSSRAFEGPALARQRAWPDHSSCALALPTQDRGKRVEDPADGCLVDHVLYRVSGVYDLSSV